MTVEELIEELKEYNGNAKVAFRDSEGFYHDYAFIGWNWFTGNDDRDKDFDDRVVISLY